MKNEEEIAELRTKNPDAESQEVSLAFELNKRTKNSLGVLQDEEFDIKEWIETSQDSEWVIKTLKIWFTMVKATNDKEWVQFPQVLNNKEFYEEAKKELLKVQDGFYKYIEESVKNFDFSQQALFRVQCLINHLPD